MCSNNCHVRLHLSFLIINIWQILRCASWITQLMRSIFTTLVLLVNFIVMLLHKAHGNILCFNIKYCIILLIIKFLIFKMYYLDMTLHLNYWILTMYVLCGRVMTFAFKLFDHKYLANLALCIMNNTINAFNFHNTCFCLSILLLCYCTQHMVISCVIILSIALYY